MKRVNTYLLITALLMIVLGVVCILNPVDIFNSMSWLVGLLILCTGVTALFFGVRAKRYLPNAGSTTLLAVFQIVVGLMMLGSNYLAATAIVAVFALWVMFEGISLAVLSFDYKRSGYERWWIMLLLGSCSLILGFLALRNPEEVKVLMGVLLGIGIFANGIERIVAFSALKRIGNTIRDIKESRDAINIDDLQNR